MSEIISFLFTGKVLVVIVVFAAIHLISILIISIINSRQNTKKTKLYQESLSESENRIQNILNQMSSNRSNLLKSLENISHTLTDKPAEQNQQANHNEQKK
jgi:hypothetical protein